MKQTSLSSIIALSIGILYTGALLHADVVTVEPSKDNTIYEEGVLSNGAGIYLFAGKTGTRADTQWRRTLMQFDLSQDIPVGSTVEAVSLSVYVSKVPPGATSQTFNLHKMTADWGEGTSNAGSPGGSGAAATLGDATWTHAFHQTKEWVFPGGDFNFSPSASTPIIGLGTYTWSSSLMLADVQGWVDDPLANFGWAALGPNVDKTARRFNSRENSNAELRPKLTITFTPPPTGWAGYLIESDGRSVNTGDYLGWIDIATKPWVYVYNLGGWTYLPESHVTETGAWSYIPK